VQPAKSRVKREASLVANTRGIAAVQVLDGPLASCAVAQVSVLNEWGPSGQPPASIRSFGCRSGRSIPSSRRNAGPSAAVLVAASRPHGETRWARTLWTPVLPVRGVSALPRPWVPRWRSPERLSPVSSLPTLARPNLGWERRSPDGATRARPRPSSQEFLAIQISVQELNGV
jgi:hypothetical protein